MTMSKFANYFRHHGVLTGVNAIALGFALVIIGYGIVKSPQHSLLLSSEVSASVPAGQMTSSSPQADLTTAALMVHEPQAVTFGEPYDRTDASRECAPDKGITDACIFN